MHAWREGWDDLAQDMSAWLGVTMVFALVSLLTCGLGLLLSPNLYLVARRARDEGRAPAPRDLLVLDHAVDLLLLGLLGLVVGLLGNVVPVLGPLLGWVLLFFVAPLVVDGRYQVVDAIRVSAQAATRRFPDVLAFTVVAALAMAASLALCVLPALVAFPWIVAASWRLYEDARPDLLTLGDELGIARRT